MNIRRKIKTERRFASHVMNIFLRCLIMTIAGVGCWQFKSYSKSPTLHPLSICDIDAALEWCDANVSYLDCGVEGIWDFPDDNVTVLIARNTVQSTNITYPTFDIIAIRTPDCRISVGQQLGKLEQLAEPSQFRLTLFTRKRGVQLVVPSSCMARLTNSGQGLKVSKAKLKFSMNPTAILSGFWKIARVRLSDPTQEAPTGLLKRYPHPSGTKSLLAPNQKIIF